MILVEKAILAVLGLDAAVAIALPVLYYVSLRADGSRSTQKRPGVAAAEPPGPRAVGRAASR